MGTLERREREKLRRRKEIADAAKKVFTRKGFKGATMEDIAREAELSPGTLYLYVKNKDELFASLNLSFLDFVQAKTDSVLANNDLTPFEKLDKMKIIFKELHEFDPFTLNRRPDDQTETKIAPAPTQTATVTTEKTILSEPLLWIAVGAAVVISGVSIGIALSSGDPDPPYAGSLNRVIYR